MLEFMSLESGKGLSSVDDAKITLGIMEYERLKELYRVSGQKAHLPLVPGAKELVDYLKEQGYPVVLISARPYEKYLNILTDTLSWARDNELAFDALYFDEEKSLKISKRFPRVRLFIDDSRDQIEEVLLSASTDQVEIQRILLLDSTGKKKVPAGVQAVKSLAEVIGILERENEEKTSDI